jgi:ATP-dependent Clp protease protease subunit
MIHQPSGRRAGPGNGHRDPGARDPVPAWQAEPDPTCRHTGQPLEQIERDTERDRFMSSEEARTYGLIDQVLERRPDELVKPG